MGTRHLICIRINRQWVVAQYGQFDGYPTGQGVRLFDFLHVEGNIARLRAGLPHIYKPTKEDIKKMNEAMEAERARVAALGKEDLCSWLAAHTTDGDYLPFEPLRNSAAIEVWDERMLKDTFSRKINDQLMIMFPSLHRETSSKILELIATATADHQLPILSELEFATDCMCEWVYVVDMDAEQLKVFRGMQYCYQGHPFEEVGGDSDLVPKLLATLTFAELQSLDKAGLSKRAGEIECGE
ncbi:hypothetical protein GGR53DRAFT_514291 [Hypoxylon sp. FL1150]|nr:hypothetical protein GGR53DRAFT_514291 [Hypoxylon sp. FL1150]